MKLKKEIVIKNFTEVEEYLSPCVLGDKFPDKPQFLFIQSYDKIKKGKYKFKYNGLKFSKCKILKKSKNYYVALTYYVNGR